MNFHEYMQLEIDSNVVENKIHLRNIVNLDDDYEVALLDIIYTHYPDSIKEIKYDNSIVGDESFDIEFTIHVPEEGVDSIHLPTEREHFLESSKYNTPDRVQLSEFDIWSYQAKNNNRIRMTITINTITSLFRDHPNIMISLLDLLKFLNAGIAHQKAAIGDVLQHTFRETNGYSKILEDKYFELPSFSVNIDKQSVHLSLPYYISSVKLSDWLHKITQIPRTFKKEFIAVPEAPLKNKTIPFKVFDPCKHLTGFIHSTSYGSVNIFVYCSLIEFQIIASITSPLLRLTSLNRTKKGINWRQFSEPQYIPLKYRQFQDFAISILDEKGKPLHFVDKIYLVLHFRKIEK